MIVREIEPGVFEAREYIDEIQLAEDFARNARVVSLRRRYVRRLEQAITHLERLPRWLAFARVRQGGEC